MLLERVCADDVSNAALPWLAGIETSIGLATAKVLRVNFVGELGYEIHHGIEYQNHIFDTLMQAGADLGLAPFGIRAMESMRIEKSYRMVGTEMSIEYPALESGLDRFIRLDKGDFLGREALLRRQAEGLRNLFVTLEVSGHNDADFAGQQPALQRRRDDRAHHERHLWFPHRQIAGARHGPPGSRCGGDTDANGSSRRTLHRHGARREPL